MLAAAIWIDRPIETDVGAIDDFVDDGARVICDGLRSDLLAVGVLLHFGISVVAKDVKREVFETVGGIQGGSAAPADRHAMRGGVGEFVVIWVGEHIPNSIALVS